MAEKISVTPYLGNDGTTGECARWTGEPTAEQAAEFVSNEWAAGPTHAPGARSEGNHSGAAQTPDAVLAGVLLILSFALLAAALIAPAFYFHSLLP